MPDPPLTSVELGGLAEAAGRSLSEVQGVLMGAEPDLAPAVAISEAELELKVAVSTVEGRLRLEPIGSAQARDGAVSPGALSSVRLRFVALPASAAAAAEAPARTPDEVVKEVAELPGIAGLARIFPDLALEARFVPSERRWIVAAREPGLGVLREVIAPDDA